MKGSWKAGHAVASAIAAFFIVSGLCGSMCAAAVCVENCDPCLGTCQCHTCDHGPALGLQLSTKISSYRLSMSDDDSGGVVRTISAIAGPSLGLAGSARELAPGDFRRCAEGVIESNGLLLQPRRGAWEPRPVEVFGDAVVVPFSSGSGATLAFLFDRRGNLTEIDEVRR